MTMIDDVIDLAKRAGVLLVKHFDEKLFCVSTKNGESGNYITTADIEVDAFLREGLAKLFPNDGLLSEESSLDDADYSKNVWMVDPLDGTKDFIHGGDGFSIIIGKCTDGIPDLGVVYAPKIGALYYAEKGKGAFLDNKKIHASKRKILSKSRMIVHIPYHDTTPKPSDDLMKNLKVAERIPAGSVGIRCGLIAEGKAEFSLGTFFRASKWDTCGPQVILEEAGGKLTDLNGDRLDYKQKPVRWLTPYIASNALLHKEALGIAKKIVNLKDHSSK